MGPGRRESDRNIQEAKKQIVKKQKDHKASSYGIYEERKRHGGLQKFFGIAFILLAFFTPVIVSFTKDWRYFLMDGLALIVFVLEEKIAGRH